MQEDGGGQKKKSGISKNNYLRKKYFLILDLVYWFCLKANASTELNKHSFCLQHVQKSCILQAFTVSSCIRSGQSQKLCLHRYRVSISFPETPVLTVQFAEFSL